MLFSHIHVICEGRGWYDMVVLYVHIHVICEGIKGWYDMVVLYVL